MLISFCGGSLVLNTDYVMSMQVYRTDEEGATQEIVIVFRGNYANKTIKNTSKALYQAVRAWMENPTQPEPSKP